jgi:hypothetical protein
MRQIIRRRYVRHKSRQWRLHDVHSGKEYTVVVEARFKSPQARKGQLYFVVRVK